MVTVNAGDFITLAAGVDLHPGVIVLREAELRAELQWNRLPHPQRQAQNGSSPHTCPVGDHPGDGRRWIRPPADCVNIGSHTCLVLLEAMAAGTPVVTSRTSSLPEVVGDAALLVDPYSPTDLAEKIAQSLNPATAEKLVSRGMAQVKKFSWEKVGAHMLDIYSEILSQPT